MDKEKKLNKDYDCVKCGLNIGEKGFEMIMLNDNLWMEISDGNPKIILCQHCIEEKLGRELQYQDLLYGVGFCRSTKEQIAEIKQREGYNPKSIAACNISSLQRMGRINVLIEYLENGGEEGRRWLDFLKRQGEL